MRKKIINCQLLIVNCLALLMLSEASMNAQVTIGSMDDPHPGALLDLKSTTRGLLLPQVALTISTVFLTAEGKTEAKGMLVYNTSNTLDGPGLYVWSGSVWNPIATNGLCSTPTMPGAITFSPALSGSIVQNTLFTASVPVKVQATSFAWSIPAGFEIVGDATGRSISIRATTIGLYAAAGITVQAINDCGSSESRAGEGTINVVGCTGAPATPSLTLINVTKINVGRTFTLRCSDVGATEYFWTLPEGLVVDSYTTTADSIVVTGAEEGVYYANTIKVKASNNCDTSAEGIGTGGIIMVETCTQAPNNPYLPSYGGRYFIGDQFDIAMSVNVKGSFVYEWSVPTGLTIIGRPSHNTPGVRVAATATGNYKSSDIKIKMTNDCGTSTFIAGSGTITILSRGTSGTDLEGDNGTYTTFKYPAGLGTWMTTNSKEGTPTWKTYSGREEGERGYYYNDTDAQTACPQGWTLPTFNQFNDLKNYLSKITTETAENIHWIGNNEFSGYVNGDDSNKGYDWDVRLMLRGKANSLFYTTPNNGWSVQANAIGGNTRLSSIRCIKTLCEEAPYILSVSNVDSILPINVPVKMWVTARSVAEGGLSYEWSLPAGASVVDVEKSGIDKDTLVVKFTSDFTGNQLSVKVSNSCKYATKSYNGTFKVVDLGAPGGELVSGSNTYRTYVFPAGLGTWMNDWSKEGNPVYKQYEGHAEGERGYYYGMGEFVIACPAGWSIPSKVALRKIFDFVDNFPTDNELYLSWLGAANRPGYKRSDAVWVNWGTEIHVWNKEGSLEYVNVAGTGFGDSARRSVRCIKDAD
jgi:uncharacterized protein (TIGR02145 family)